MIILLHEYPSFAFKACHLLHKIIWTHQSFITTHEIIMMKGYRLGTGIHINDPKAATHFISEYISNRLFWMGVPVTAHRARACSLHTAMDVWIWGFFTLWASSSMIRAQTTWSKGAETPWKKQSDSQHQYGTMPVPPEMRGHDHSAEDALWLSSLLTPFHWTKFRNQGQNFSKSSSKWLLKSLSLNLKS